MSQSVKAYERSPVKIRERISPPKQEYHTSTVSNIDADVRTRRHLTNFFSAWLYKHLEDKDEWKYAIVVRTRLDFKMASRIFKEWKRTTKRLIYLRFIETKMVAKRDRMFRRQMWEQMKSLRERRIKLGKDLERVFDKIRTRLAMKRIKAKSS